jgi:hypothetical protein
VPDAAARFVRAVAGARAGGFGKFFCLHRNAGSGGFSRVPFICGPPAGGSEFALREWRHAVLIFRYTMAACLEIVVYQRFQGASRFY